MLLNIIYIKFCWRDGHCAVVFSLQSSYSVHSECDQFYVTNSLTWTYFVYVIVGSRYTQIEGILILHTPNAFEMWYVWVLSIYDRRRVIRTSYTIQILYFDNSVEPTWSHITASIWEQRRYFRNGHKALHNAYIVCLSRSY